METPPRYSIVVPVYNEQEILPELTRRLQETLARLGGPAEILFVNDGSVDGTLSILKALRFEDKRIRLISLSRNFGHQAAVTAGLAYAEREAVAILDGDLQDPPELLRVSARRLGEGAVYAQSVTLDQELTHLDRIDLIKMDIEGHEPLALRGASELIRRHRPTLLTEFNPRCLAGNERVDLTGQGLPPDGMLTFDVVATDEPLADPTGRRGREA